MEFRIEIRVVNKSGHALPAYETAGAAGLDLRASVDHRVQIAPWQRALIPTGLYIELPPGTEGQVRPRSGLALRHGITVLNAPGTIDADYRGEVKVLLINLGEEIWEVNNGDRIAQLVVARHGTVSWTPVEDLKETHRGTGGYGSTGAQ